MRVRRAVAAILAGAAAMMTGFLFDAAPLFVSGVAFAVLGLAAPAWVWLSARGARIERRLERGQVVEGEGLEAWLELRGGPLGLPGGEIVDPLLGEPLPLPGGRRASIKVLARFGRRGRRRLPPPVLLVRDPLELAECLRPSSTPVQEILVLPRTERVSFSQRDGKAPSSAAARSRADLLAAVEVDGLQPYRHGTPASRIHWPALARGSGLLERRLRVDGDTVPLVVLDARCSGREEHLDQAVRAAASITLELARAGGCRLLLPGTRKAMVIESDLSSWPLAHARLALVEDRPGARAPSAAVIRATLGPLFYITARRLDRVPRTIGRGAAAASAAILVVPAAVAPQDRGRPRLAVSGCVGFRAGAPHRATAEARAAGRAAA